VTEDAFPNPGDEGAIAGWFSSLLGEQADYSDKLYETRLTLWPGGREGLVARSGAQGRPHALPGCERLTDVVAKG
jgi:hypothetical protein